MHAHVSQILHHQNEAKLLKQNLTRNISENWTLALKPICGGSSTVRTRLGTAARFGAVRPTSAELRPRPPQLRCVHARKSCERAGRRGARGGGGQASRFNGHTVTRSGPGRADLRCWRGTFLPVSGEGGRSSAAADRPPALSCVVDGHSGLERQHAGCAIADRSSLTLERDG